MTAVVLLVSLSYFLELELWNCICWKELASKKEWNVDANGFWFVYTEYGEKFGIPIGVFSSKKVSTWCC